MIRRACLEDAESIAAIHVRSWQEGYRGIIPDDFLRSLSIEQRTKVWQDALRLPTSDTWVAEDEGHLLGWITAGTSRDDDAAPETAELWAIYVDPLAWRSGVGRALWQQAEAHLLQDQFRNVTLWVLAENQRALRFYESLGFSRDCGHEKMWERGGASLQEIRLRRALCG